MSLSELPYVRCASRSPRVARRPISHLTAFVASLVFVVVARVPLGAQAPEPLFAVAPNLAAPAVADTRPFFVRSRTAQLRLGVLDRALAPPAASTFSLNLFDEATFAVTAERVEDSGFGQRTWVGHITDRPMSAVTLTMTGDFITGLITDGRTVYEIHGLGGGAHRIDELDTTKMRRGTDTGVVPPSAAAADAPAAPVLESPAAEWSPEIFVYYSSTLRARVGLLGVENRIAQYIADINTAFARSGLDGQRVHLVGSGELPVPEPPPPSTLEVFNSAAVVIAQRNASRADLVTLLVSETPPTSTGEVNCGSWWQGPPHVDYFTSIVASSSECLYQMAHAVGHNLGAQHAPDDPGVLWVSPSMPAHSRAYKAPDHAFRTIMALDCTTPPSCPRILNFSSSLVLEGGQPTGVFRRQDNALRIAETISQIDLYRSGGPSTPTAPRSLQAVPNGLNITLQWQPPALGTPTSYRVVAGMQSGFADIGQVNVGLVTSVSARLPAGTYFARVYAQNSRGMSLASNEVSFTLSLGPPPDPPTSFVANVDGSNVSMSWLAPSTGGPPADYLLEAGTESGLANLVPGLPVSGTGLNVGGVPQGRYFLRVRARSLSGISAPSNEVEIFVGPSCTLPSSPLSLTATNEGSVVTVSWSKPAVGLPAAYILQAGLSSGAADVFNGSVGPTTVVSAPAPNGTYFLRVLAMNACGTGPASGEVTLNVP